MTARVLVLTLGGTIASLPSESGAGGGAIPTLTGDDLLAMAPGLAQVADVTARTLMQVPSCDIRPADVRAVAETIAVAVGTGGTGSAGTGEPPADGIVVVQGTDTLEETAYLLDLLLDIEAPVVVTGAMRTPSTPGADGPANLIASVQVAADPAARGLGALVVLSDEIHAAAHVAKTHSSATDAFTSPGFGPIGRVVEGRVHIYARPVRQHERVDVPPDATWPYVPILRVAQGTRPVEVDALAAIADALIVEATGGGHVPADLVPVLEAVAHRIPVVLTSRTGAGGTLESTYGYPGSEMDLLGRGVVSSGPLDAVKARLWLGARLAAGLPVASSAAG